MAERLRVAIAEDQLSARCGLKALLALLPEFEVIGEAVDGEEAVRLVESDHPDVVLMDALMPRMSGLEATHVIKSRWPDVRIVIVTVCPAVRREPFCDEADSFLLKGFGPAELREAVFGAQERSGAASPSALEETNHGARPKGHRERNLP